MDSLMSGDTPDETVAAFLTSLRAKGETAVEISGLLDGLIAASVRVDVSGAVADVVGTGGDGLHTVNISTMAAIVLAAGGVRVVKHGNRAASSKCGSADVLEELGVVVALPPEGVRACVDAVNIGFCFAPAYHPAMRHVAAVRRHLGTPTVFNLLGPLANPAGASHMLVGCADERRQPLLADVLAARGVTAAVVRAGDGMDEVSTSVETVVWTGGVVGRIDPRLLGVPQASPTLLTGGDAQTNAQVVRDVFAGRRTERLDAVRDCVLLNAAAALAVARTSPEAPSDLVAQLSSCLEQVSDVLGSGAAQHVLDDWVDLSRSVA